MVQGLLIRQIFLLIDVILAVGIVVAAPFVVLSAVGKGPDIATLLADKAKAPTDELAINSVAHVGPASTYSTILSNGLFGDAGRFNKDAAPVAPPVEPSKEIEETTLDLRLIGTTVAAKHSSAIIENMEDSMTGIHFLDRVIAENVTLIEVKQREVIILNERLTPPATQKLSMDEQPDTPLVGRVVGVKPRVNIAQNQVVELNRNEMIQELYASYADLVTKVKPEVVTDNNGKVIGYTAQNISQIPIAKKLGLSDGDVLQSVNNENIDSEQKIMQLVQKYRNAGSVRIGIIRNNQPKIITYNLR